MPSRTTSGHSLRFLLRSFWDKFKRKVKGKPQETGQPLAWRKRVGDVPPRGPGSWALSKLQRLWKERCPHESPDMGHKPLSSSAVDRDGEGQGSLVCCGPWGCQELDTTMRLNCKKQPLLKLGLSLMIANKGQQPAHYLLL